MYSINIQSSNDCKPVFNRSLSSNTAIETLPIIVEICRSEFNMANPVALFMGDNVYRIFDLNNPSVYAMVSVIRNAN